MGGGGGVLGLAGSWKRRWCSVDGRGTGYARSERSRSRDLFVTESGN